MATRATSVRVRRPEVVRPRSVTPSEPGRRASCVEVVITSPGRSDPFRLRLQVARTVGEGGVERLLERPPQDACHQPVVRLLRAHEGLPVLRREMPDMDRPDPERPAAPGQDRGGIDVLDDRRDRSRPGLPAERRALGERAGERDGFHVRVPRRPFLDRRENGPDAVDRRVDLELGGRDDGSVARDRRLGTGRLTGHLVLSFVAKAAAGRSRLPPVSATRTGALPGRSDATHAWPGGSPRARPRRSPRG